MFGSCEEVASPHIPMHKYALLLTFSWESDQQQ